MAECPRCGSVLDFEDEELEEGDVFTCADCQAGLEVVRKHPVQLTATGGEASDDPDGEDEISDNGNLT